MSVSLERSLTYGCPSSCSKPPCFLDVIAVNYVSLSMHYSYSIYSSPTPKNTKESGKLADCILWFGAASIFVLLQCLNFSLNQGGLWLGYHRLSAHKVGIIYSWDVFLFFFKFLLKHTCNLIAQHVLRLQLSIINYILMLFSWVEVRICYSNCMGNSINA